jgi:hypothetical protein
MTKKDYKLYTYAYMNSLIINFSFNLYIVHYLKKENKFPLSIVQIEKSDSRWISDVQPTRVVFEYDPYISLPSEK